MSVNRAVNKNLGELKFKMNILDGISEWSEWGECTGICGDQFSQTRTRSCLYPPMDGSTIVTEQTQNCDILSGTLIEYLSKTALRQNKFSEWSSVTSVWHGDDDIAVYTTEGGSKPEPNSPRDPTLMFDDDLTTYWHSATNGGKVTVTFHEEIYFEKLEIIKRPGAFWWNR